MSGFIYDFTMTKKLCRLKQVIFEIGCFHLFWESTNVNIISLPLLTGSVAKDESMEESNADGNMEESNADGSMEESNADGNKGTIFY